MIDEDLFLSLLFAALIVALDWRSGDGSQAIYFGGFAALAALAWTLDEPARSWRGWLPVALMVGYGLARRYLRERAIRRAIDREMAARRH